MQRLNHFCAKGARKDFSLLFLLGKNPIDLDMSLFVSCPIFSQARELSDERSVLTRLSAAQTLLKGEFQLGVW